jgi:hypothetical protein
MNQELTHKHHAVIAVLACILLFLLLTLGYWILFRPSITQAPGGVATTTAQTPQKLAIVENAPYYDINAAYPSTAGLPGESDACDEGIC